MRLEIKDLHVHYGKIEAIKGVSIVVNERRFAMRVTQFYSSNTICP